MSALGHKRTGFVASSAALRSHVVLDAEESAKRANDERNYNRRYTATIDARTDPAIATCGRTMRIMPPIVISQPRTVMNTRQSACHVLCRLTMAKAREERQ